MHAGLGFSSQLLMLFPDMRVAKKKERKESDFLKLALHCIGLMRGQKGQSVVRHNDKLAQQIASHDQDLSSLTHI
jgi:hypothetical protein